MSEQKVYPEEGWMPCRIDYDVLEQKNAQLRTRIEELESQLLATGLQRRPSPAWK